ncbi:MAG: hypothetical protein RL226_1568, partial [Bacteroidota bacterium]
MSACVEFLNQFLTVGHYCIWRESLNTIFALQSTTMKNLAYFILPVLVACSSNTEKQVQSITYPSTRKEAVVDSLWGTAVEDPYRWLEDDRSEETGAWVKAQNAVTRSFLDSIPYRNDIRDRFKELINYERVSSPFKTGNWYFIYKNDGLQNQDVIYVREGRDGAERVFIDA